MVVTGNWADIINPAFTKIFDDVYSRFPEEYSTIYTLETSEQNYEKYSTASGFAMGRDVDEGEEIPVDDPVQGFDSTFTHSKMGLAFNVSRETLEDDLYNVMAAKPKSLANGIRRKVETDAASIVINADNTTKATGPDGSAWAANAHTREDGGATTTQDNIQTSALSEAALETAFVLFAGWLDGKGQKILVQPDLLVVQINKELEARVLLESAGRINTTYTNEINPYHGRLDLFVWHWLTNSNDYFLIDRSWDFIKFIWRKQVQLERDDNVSNQVARWFASCRYSYGWTDWRNFFMGNASS